MLKSLHSVSLPFLLGWDHRMAALTSAGDRGWLNCVWQANPTFACSLSRGIHWRFKIPWKWKLPWEMEAFCELQQFPNLSSIVNIEFSCFHWFRPSPRWVPWLEIGSLLFELLLNFVSTQRAAGAQCYLGVSGKGTQIPLQVGFVIHAASFQTFFMPMGNENHQQVIFFQHL